jgi:hypothetical protein
MGSFAEGVDYYHYRIVSVRLQEFDYEVDTYGVPADVRCWKELEVAGRWPSQDLGAEAEIASSSVLTNVPRHVRPPVIPCDQLECFLPARMPGNMTVLVKCHYLLSNVGSRGNIDLPWKYSTPSASDHLEERMEQAEVDFSALTACFTVSSSSSPFVSLWMSRSKSHS